MHISLFVLGVVTAIAGFLAIVYGIPVNEFSFGNTLIVAGTIAVVGGFLLIGLAAVVRQLRQLAEPDPLHQTSMALPSHPVDPVKPTAQPGFPAGQVMAPTPVSAPLKLAPSPRALGPSEPALSAVPSAEAGPPDWLRPKEKALSLGGQSLIEEIEASLSPQLMPQPLSPPPPLKVYDQSFDPRMPLQNRPAEPAAGLDQAIGAEPPARAVSSAENAAPSGLFETVWPEIKPARHPETIARARKPDTVTPPRSEGAARDQAKAGKDNAREPQNAVREEPRPVAILKSGMIDGMAYTLFADGSIEAVLATGTVRFASIDALRFHLEQNS